MKKTIVIYYSYTGHTRKLAAEIAEKEAAPLLEIVDRKRPGTLAAYTVGCFAAMRQKATPIGEIETELDQYERFVILAPVWAGFPAPAINTLLKQLPSSRDVEVWLVSASGQSRARDKMQTLINSQGCRLMRFRDVRATAKAQPQ